MRDYEYLISIALRDKLKESITGRLIVDEIAATVVANYKKYILAYFTY